MKVTMNLDDFTLRLLEQLQKEKFTGSRGRTVEFLIKDYSKLNMSYKTLLKLTEYSGGNAE